MFDKVLLDLGASVDGHLITQAVDFCQKADASLTVMNAFEEPSQSVASYFSSQRKDLRDLILDNHNVILAGEMAKKGINPESLTRKIRWGKDFIETIKEVKEGGYDLVISASQKPDGPPDSTAMHLMRKCPCPVWIHRGHLWKGATRLLVAINTSDSSEENRKLNQKILEHSITLNTILRGHLHIVSCWAGYMESVLTSPRFNEKEKAAYLEFERKETEKELHALSNAADLPKTCKAKILHGDPAELIPRYAADQKMDIVIMGSVARTGIPGLLVGNTAEKIVANLDESIIAVKPNGFVSPVH